MLRKVGMETAIEIAPASAARQVVCNVRLKINFYLGVH